MRRAAGLGGASLLGLGALAALALSGSGESAAKKDAPTPAPAPAPVPAPALGPDEAHDDETALARMLASETDNRNGRIVMGWIAFERARRRRESIYDLVTTGKGYGHKPGRYANTAEKPTAATRDLAQRILRGELRASAAIRRHPPGSWVERKQKGKQKVSDADIIALQATFDEGIYARLSGTDWVLFSRDAPRIIIAPYRDATERLNNLPQVPALDPEVA